MATVNSRTTIGLLLAGLVACSLSLEAAACERERLRIAYFTRYKVPEISAMDLARLGKSQDFEAMIEWHIAHLKSLDPSKYTEEDNLAYGHTRGLADAITMELWDVKPLYDKLQGIEKLEDFDLIVEETGIIFSKQRTAKELVNITSRIKNSGDPVDGRAVPTTQKVAVINLAEVFRAIHTVTAAQVQAEKGDTSAKFEKFYELIARIRTGISPLDFYSGADSPASKAYLERRSLIRKAASAVAREKSLTLIVDAGSVVRGNEALSKMNCDVTTQVIERLRKPSN
jgi:hypothetical protein